MPPRPPRPPRLFILRPGSAYHVRHCGPMGGHHLPIGRLGRLWSSRMACAGRPPRVTHHGDAVAPPRRRYARGRPPPPLPPQHPHASLPSPAGWILLHHARWLVPRVVWEPDLPCGEWKNIHRGGGRPDCVGGSVGSGGRIPVALGSRASVRGECAEVGTGSRPPRPSPSAPPTTARGRCGRAPLPPPSTPGGNVSPPATPCPPHEITPQTRGAPARPPAPFPPLVLVPQPCARADAFPPPPFPPEFSFVLPCPPPPLSVQQQECHRGGRHPHLPPPAGCPLPVGLSLTGAGGESTFFIAARPPAAGWCVPPWRRPLGGPPTVCTVQG